MKSLLRKMFWPILKFFETGAEPVNYRKSHRVALIVVGVLFLGLSIGASIAAGYSGDPGAMIPFVVFFCLGLVALVVGTLGSNAAVAKIWGTG